MNAEISPQQTPAYTTMADGTTPTTSATSAAPGSSWGQCVLFVVAAALIAFGWLAPTHRYLTPESGFGYVLGIVGGSLMLLLLIYPARKRLRSLAFLGSVKGWFRLHMTFGIVGPICVLYHTNFSLGAVNSNVALFCMLIVSGSGLIGRYFYTKIHHGLYGRETTLAELQQSADRLRRATISIEHLPELLERIQREEQQLLITATRHNFLLRPLAAAWLGAQARRRLHGYIATSLAAVTHARGTAGKAQTYVHARLHATQRVVEFQAFTRLFSWWHILHLPLFFMLLLAGTAHVIAVHLY